MQPAQDKASLLALLAFCLAGAVVLPFAFLEGDLALLLIIILFLVGISLAVASYSMSKGKSGDGWHFVRIVSLGSLAFFALEAIALSNSTLIDSVRIAML